METNQPLNEASDIFDALDQLVRPGIPSFFTLAAHLPTEGRTDTPVAASENMTVLVKSYASGGENELHAHPNEDHAFIVLQGEATFYGPKNETKSLRKHGGVMLPHGVFYRFQSTGSDPLVMIRVGSKTRSDDDVYARVDMEGHHFPGNSKANRQVPLSLSGQWFGRD
ncbi:cupin domain-containing protein [Variovorax ginsengisoli]|uniref:Cupin domain-containing protein n=1 Tax=Variovorax ginsengisoli TaxID=363844 RepID=A0ABT8SEW9_9BURK|nr:cupin domain-containing protein [Variovorax ginsengisoli]MDN8617517.1 cupin domain-containing protein [Variovorax ginsengisoli]MDO1536687.1 cupin domain-containing protein [Variovorax ginsengisoli]